MRCVSCGSLDVEYDVSRGSSICTVCGTILSESSVVSEVAFSDATSSGLSAVVGTFVSHTSVGTGRGLSLTARHGGVGGMGAARRPGASAHLVLETLRSSTWLPAERCDDLCAWWRPRLRLRWMELY